MDAADGAKKLMARLKLSFPPDLDYVVALDTTLAVTEGMKEIEHTLFEAIVLVIIVVFIFLQGWRATLIPLLAVPVSLVGTFALFPLFGFSINTLSLFGLVLAIGLVVDDAIVVVEIVEHHIEHGLSPKEAALKGMQEVSGPVIAIAIILTAVFVPDRLHPRHHRPALPAVRRDHRGVGHHLCVQRADAVARVGGAAAPAQEEGFRPAAEVLRCGSTNGSAGPPMAMSGVCRFLVHKSAFALLLLAGTAVLAGLLGKSIATSFLPDEDQGYVFAGIQLPEYRLAAAQR